MINRNNKQTDIGLKKFRKRKKKKTKKQKKKKKKKKNKQTNKKKKTNKKTTTKKQQQQQQQQQKIQKICLIMYASPPPPTHTPISPPAYLSEDYTFYIVLHYFFLTKNVNIHIDIVYIRYFHIARTCYVIYTVAK